MSYLKLIDPKPQHFYWQRWIPSLALTTISTIFSIIPVKAAQTIDFYYGPLGFSIDIESLELFAKEGKINRQLDFYLSRVEPEAREKFRKALLRREDVNPVELYRFFRTPIGEKILIQVGNLINFPRGGNGKYGIRAALVKAAFDTEEGLTLLNFLRQFPTDIELNTNNILLVRDLVQLLVRGTKRLEQEMASLSSQEAANSTPVDFSKLPDLRLPGKYGYIKQTLTLNDTSRQRQLIVDLYKPQTWREGKTPVVVASHGLASNRQYFKNGAQHLASYGFVVAVPQHPGSDSIYFEEMLQGYHRKIFKLNEFIDRPLDISYVLDELERRNDTEFEGRLNLEAVGVMGHSFGGYTALTIAGARINFERLKQDCDKIIWDPNLSLLLQCRALNLPRQSYDFRDRRVGAIFVLNPVTSSIFGAKSLSEIQIPVLIGAGDRDPATPAAIEQIVPFTFLTTSDRYLALLKGQAHVDISTLDGGAMEAIESLAEVELSEEELVNVELLDQYGNAISTAFLEYYIANNADYLPYLQSSYAQYLSEQPFPIYLIGASSVEALKQTIEDFVAEEKLLEKRDIQ
ncbi:MAG: alpha/beta hydrolase [Prochloraceae cyanobacterium]